MCKWYILMTGFIFLSFLTSIHSSSCPMNIEGENWICAGETTVLTAAAGFSEYYWSTGEKGRSITVGTGRYRVVGRTEDGCVGSAEFLIQELRLPQDFGLKILGASRVEGAYWTDNHYSIYPYNEHFTYFWTLDGDTVGQGPELEIDSLLIGAYQLKIDARSPCSGQSVSTFVLLQPYEGNNESKTIYSCSSEPPYYYLSVPFPGPGLYDIVSVNNVGFQIGARRQLVIEPQESTSFDTVRLCGDNPIFYYGVTIGQAGSYEIPVKDHNLGCRELIHLEALERVEQPKSLKTYTHCGEGGFELDGEFYTMPGLYERGYSLPGGCDSLAITFIEYAYELPASEIFAEVCPGEVYQHDGESYSEEGAYTRAYPLENGCDSTVTIHLIQRENPRGETRHYFCNGDSVELGGVFFTESGVLEYLVPGQGEACDSLITAFVQELAPIEIEQQWLSPDEGDGTGAIELLLTGGLPPYTYSWSNGAVSPNIGSLPAGDYSLMVTDERGCTASFAFELDLLSGTSAPEAGRQLALGPNPFGEELRLFGGSGLYFPEPALHLYDASGRPVLKVPFSEGIARLPSGLPGGLYWYRLEAAGEILLEGKIIRQ